jgi:cysteine-rich repeat protein
MTQRAARLAIVVLVLVGHAGRPAAAGFDATGVFTLTGIPGIDAVSLAQVGTGLTMCALIQDQIVKVARGSVNPATGNFTMNWTLLGPGGLGAYCSIVWSGTFAPDGASFTAQVTERSTCVPPPFTCTPSCVISAQYAVSGSRTQTAPAPCCLDGIAVAPEQCDDGNTFTGDCCTPTCQLEPAGTPCGTGCDVRECDAAGMCVDP